MPQESPGPCSSFHPLCLLSPGSISGLLVHRNESVREECHYLSLHHPEALPWQYWPIPTYFNTWNLTGSARGDASPLRKSDHDNRMCPPGFRRKTWFSGSRQLNPGWVHIWKSFSCVEFFPLSVCWMNTTVWVFHCLAFGDFHCPMWESWTVRFLEIMDCQFSRHAEGSCFLSPAKLCDPWSFLWAAIKISEFFFSSLQLR